MRSVLSIVALLALATPSLAQSSTGLSSSSAVRASSSSSGANLPSNSSSGVFFGSSTGSTIPSNSSSGAFIGLSSSSSGSSSGNATLSPEQSNDLAVLNTALTVAHLEASYFGCQLSPLYQTLDYCNNQTTATFSLADFQAVGFNSSVFEAFETVASQAAEHVDLLTRTISSLTNAAPVPRCEAYNYQRTGSIPSNSNQTIWTFFAGAQSLTGSSASIHLGALASVTSSDLITVVAALAANEARHNSYFYQQLGFSPFSSAGFDGPVSMTQASLILQSWMLRCSQVSFTLPTIRPYGIALDTTNTTNEGFAQGTVFTGPLSSRSDLTYTPQQRVNDVLTLKYLLFIESLQLAMFNASNKWNVTNWASAGYNQSVYNIVQDVSDNEETHSSVLQSMLMLYDDSISSDDQCVYNLTSVSSNIDNFVQALSLIKQWSSSAYVGAASSVTDTDLQQLIGSITTIEARHSAILNLVASGNRNMPLIAVNQSSAFPLAVENILTPGQAIDQLNALNLIVSCTNNLTLPGVAPFVIPSPQNNQTMSSSTGAFFNQSSSSGTFANVTSSTGVIGNLTSSTGAFFNQSSSSGAFANITSSSGIFVNVTSSSGAFVNRTSSSSSGSFMNITSSSSGSFVNRTSSSSGVFANVTSSSGSFGNFSSTGAFNQSTGLPNSSTGLRNASSSSSTPFGTLSSSARASSSAASSSAASSSAASSSAASSSASPSSSSNPLARSSSSSGPSVQSSSAVASPSSSSSATFEFSSTGAFDISSTGEDVEDPGVNSASALEKHFTLVVAMIVAVAAYVL